MLKNIKKANLCMLTVLVMLTNGCGISPVVSRPTLDPNIIETIAAKTVQAQLAETVAAAPPTLTVPIPTPAPTSTPTLTPVPTQTSAVLPTLLLTPATTVVTDSAGTVSTGSDTMTPFPQPSGDFGIPVDHDPVNGTSLQKNQDFDMTWTFKNTGTTTWNNKYYITFFGGNRIGNGDNTYFLVKEVKPGELGSITVKMIAPDRTGDYKSIWMLMSDQNKAIIELNVLINVP